MIKPEIELYAIRHAECENNVNNHIVGGRSNESPLTQRGIEQAKQLGRYLLANDVTPDFVYISPAVRTRDTARFALEELGIDIDPVVEHDLQELDQGLWTGRLRTETYTPDVLAEIARQGKDFKADGGESMNETGQRMLRAASVIADRHVDDDGTQRGFMFTHGFATRCLASTINDWSHQQTFETETPNASISLFTRTSGVWKMEYIGKKPE